MVFSKGPKWAKDRPRNGHDLDLYTPPSLLPVSIIPYYIRCMSTQG